ncbi:MAG: tetratricopeptide repeat protein [Thermoanaerobacteraceae bacterium]|nr:tetratricopeptide repeat protein [Thermoanaerobacteraceae bacterium]
MGDLINLYYLLSEIFPGSMEIVLNTIIIAAATFIAYKSQSIKHPRYFSRFIVLIILFLLIANAVFLGLIETGDKKVLIVLTILMILYIAVGCFAAKGPIGLSKWKLKKLEEMIDQGLSWDRDDLFSKKPFYIMDFAENYQYELLHAKHWIILKNYKKAYEIYNGIIESKLFDDEKKKISIEKAYMLYGLGDINRATGILESIKDKNDPNYLMLKSMITENALDLDNAVIYLQKALNNISITNNGILEAMIYNNYGRIRRIEGNNLDAIYYYRKSADIAKKYKEKQIIHTSFQNLIHLLLIEGDLDKSNAYLKEYEDLIDLNLLGDAVEYYNLKLELSRQKPNGISEYSIVDNYKNLRERLPQFKKLQLDCSTLRILFNACMNFDVVMDQIYSNLDEYFALEMPYKYFSLKEIEIPLREINYPYCHKYALIYKRIADYMRTKALTDIEEYISSLKDYEINLRCQMEKERVGVIKEHIKPYNFQTIYNHMIDIKDIYKRNGMLVDMIITDLDIADECFAPENLEGEEIKALPLEKMKEHIEYAEESVSKLKKYPIVDEFNIRLAVYFFKLKDESKAKKYLEKFESGGTTIANYAFWIQRDYRFLKSKLRIARSTSDP